MFAETFMEQRFKPIGKERLAGLADQLRNCNQEGFKRVHSNTTVFALKYIGGVLIAGDRRTSDGNLGIVSDNSTKVMELSKHSAMACAGFCNIISFLEDNMASICKSFKNLYKQDLSPDGQASFMQKLLEPWWLMAVYTWYWAVGIPILATYDLATDTPRIFVFDESGYYYEPEFLGGAGCGYDFIKGLIVDHWRSDMSESSAIAIATKAMLHSGALSHGVSDARLNLPTIAVVDKNGFRWISERSIMRVLDLIIKQTDGLR